MIAQKDTLLVAEKSVTLSLALQRRLGAGLFGGEGLFFVTLTGLGRVWLQTMPMSKLAGAIRQFLPKAEGSNEQGINIKLG
jgi:uncharacterized protein (AIM24 family)